MKNTKNFEFLDIAGNKNKTCRRFKSVWIIFFVVLVMKEKNAGAFDRPQLRQFISNRDFSSSMSDFEKKA